MTETVRVELFGELEDVPIHDREEILTVLGCEYIWADYEAGVDIFQDRDGNFVGCRVREQTKFRTQK